MSACFAVSVAIFKSFSFGAYVGSDCRTEMRPAKCCMSWSYDWCDELMVVGAGVFGSTCVATLVERCPCILRLKPFASAIFSVLASVV